jgi:hypothetical protein
LTAVVPMSMPIVIGSFLGRKLRTLVMSGAHLGAVTAEGVFMTPGGKRRIARLDG